MDKIASTGRIIRSILIPLVLAALATAVSVLLFMEVMPLEGAKVLSARERLLYLIDPNFLRIVVLPEFLFFWVLSFISYATGYISEVRRPR